MTPQHTQFLASERPDLPPSQCRFHVIPAPMEQSVSYGSGTALGPQAILNASYQLEAWNGTSEPVRQGIHTTPPIDCSLPPEAVLDAIQQQVTTALDGGHIPILLGGEHTVTLGALRALHARGPFGVIQFDAHADLRDSYEGTPLSHACVMRRAHDLGIPIFQLGVRALSRDEHLLRQHDHIPHLDAEQLSTLAPESIQLPANFPRDIYITFDVDAFDASLLPATGTPEPGGLHWWPALQALRAIAKQRRIIGFDVVELAPRPELHACDFTAAKLLYELMGLA